MVFTGLIEKLKGKAKAASFATKLAIAGGLSSLVSPHYSDAQTTLYLNSEVKDSNGQVISSGGNLQAGQTYTGILSIKFVDPSQSLINPTSLETAFRATFGGLANSSNVNIQYTSNSNSNLQGVPTSGDLFSGATMSTSNGQNNTTYSSDVSTVTLGYSRFATSNPTNLLNGQNVPFLTFTITPQSTATSGTLNFDYLSGSSIIAFNDVNGANNFIGNQINFTYNGVSASNGISFNFVGVAVPEPSTYALIAGGAALIGAAALRRRRKLMQANGKMYELSGEYQNGKDIINVRQIGNISDKQ